jgi:hypothetical protein
MYAQAQKEAAGGATGTGPTAENAPNQGEEKVVDAEYTEVKDRK